MHLVFNKMPKIACYRNKMPQFETLKELVKPAIQQTGNSKSDQH